MNRRSLREYFHAVPVGIISVSFNFNLTINPIRGQNASVQPMLPLTKVHVSRYQKRNFDIAAVFVPDDNLHFLSKFRFVQHRHGVIGNKRETHLSGAIAIKNNLCHLSHPSLQRVSNTQNYIIVLIKSQQCSC